MKNKTFIVQKTLFFVLILLLLQPVIAKNRIIGRIIPIKVYYKDNGTVFHLPVSQLKVELATPVEVVPLARGIKKDLSTAVTYPDSNGNYSFRGISPGSYLLKIKVDLTWKAGAAPKTIHSKRIEVTYKNGICRLFPIRLYN